MDSTLKTAYKTPQREEVVLDTLELHHSDFSNPIRMVRGYEDFETTLEGDKVVFEARSLNFSHPSQSTQSTPKVSIEVDNVNRILMTKIEKTCSSPHKITGVYRAYLNTAPTAPKASHSFVIESIETDLSTITFRASFLKIENKPFPPKTYTLSTFPGLARG